MKIEKLNLRQIDQDLQPGVRVIFFEPAGVLWGLFHGVLGSSRPFFSQHYTNTPNINQQGYSIYVFVMPGASRDKPCVSLWQHKHEACNCAARCGH